MNIYQLTISLILHTITLVFFKHISALASKNVFLPLKKIVLLLVFHIIMLFIVWSMSFSGAYPQIYLSLLSWDVFQGLSRVLISLSLGKKKLAAVTYSTNFNDLNGWKFIFYRRVGVGISWREWRKWCRDSGFFGVLPRCFWSQLCSSPSSHWKGQEWEDFMGKAWKYTRCRPCSPSIGWASVTPSHWAAEGAGNVVRDSRKL